MMQINKSLFPATASYSGVSKLQQTMQKLQMQLSSGEKAQTLSELGNQRTFDLTLRHRLSRIEGFQSTINTVNLRLGFLDNSLKRLDEIEAQARGSAAGGVGPNNINMAAAKNLAIARLDEVLSIVNGDINGRYMFGGSVSDAKPAASYAEIMNGSGNRDGFSTIVAQRKAADAGANGMGRLVTDLASMAVGTGGAAHIVTLTEADGTLHPHGPKISGIATSSGAIAVTAPAGVPPQSEVAFAHSPFPPAPGDTITLTLTQPNGSAETVEFTAVAAEPAGPREFVIGANRIATAANFRTKLDAAMQADTVALAEDGTHPFGFKLAGLQATGAALGALAPGGVPRAAAVQVTGTPAVGDTIKASFILPDGSSADITLKAVSGTPQGPGEFTIGASRADTASAIKAALEGELQRSAEGPLRAASVHAAADNFFNGRGETALRVDGPPYESATALVAATNANTVLWYRGEDATGSPRQTVMARVEENTTVQYGVQANERGIVELVRSLASIAVETFTGNQAETRYSNMMDTQLRRLGEANDGREGSLEVISLELSMAFATSGQASERQTYYSAQLETMLAEITQAPIEEVAVQLLQIRTRLEASYQTMGVLSKLTLVNYIG